MTIITPEQITIVATAAVFYVLLSEIKSRWPEKHAKIYYPSLSSKLHSKHLETDTKQKKRKKIGKEQKQ